MLPLEKCLELASPESLPEPRCELVHQATGGGKNNRLVEASCLGRLRGNSAGLSSRRRVDENPSTMNPSR
jgi:hypothetical protein